MCLIDFQGIQHRADIVARAVLRIFFRIFRYVRWGITARVEGNASVVFREMPDLLLVRTIIAGEFVDEDNWNSFAGFFMVKLDSVVGRQVWHVVLLIFRKQMCARRGGGR